MSGGSLYSQIPIIPPERRPFSQNDYKWTKIPVAFSSVSLDNIQDNDTKKIIIKYIENIQDMLSRPMGLFLTGITGVGKSAIAALIAKEAVCRFKSIYWVNFAELHDLQFKSLKTTTDGTPISDHIKHVDLLVLDGFNIDFIDNKIYDQVKLERLIGARADNMKTTILTSRISPEKLSEDSLSSLRSMISGCMIPIKLVGKDLRFTKSREALDFLRSKDK